MNKTCMVLGLAGMLAAPKLFAAMDVTLMDDTPAMNASYSYSQGDGGEFRAVGDSGLNSIVNWSAYAATTQGTVTAANDGSSWGYGQGLAVPGSRYFQTFCTELLEEYTPGGLYPVSSIGNDALYNDSPTHTPVPITLGVAYLYSQFAAGTLAGYDYSYTDGGGRSASAGNLQNAIWYLLGEGGSLSGTALTDLQHSGIAEADWTAAANGAYGVADMTLDNPGQAQDQLVMVAVPEAPTVVAGVLLLLPFGASTLRILRRKRIES